MNPPATSIKGLIKPHKLDQPIQPVVNWRNAPAYKLSKLFTNKINYIMPLPNAFNVNNMTDLIQNLKDTPLLPHFTFASLDITNLYSNTPVTKTKTILTNMLKQKLVDTQIQQDILMRYDIIIGQNYFANNKDTVNQYDGLAMGTQSSGLIAEMFLQNIEHLHLTYLTHKHKIINYWTYVDDILLIFYSNHTNIQEILDDFNSLHPKLHFTAEAERDHTISYLDISIHRTPTSIKTSIYRKPTFTDTIIPYTSNHPSQHKYSAVKFLFNRLNSYNLQQEDYRQELNTIHNILHNNSFPITPHHPPIHTTRHKQITQTPKKKWAIFTYVGKETSYITNLLRKTHLKIT
jgi:hypothetical protein